MKSLKTKFFLAIVFISSSILATAAQIKEGDSLANKQELIFATSTIGNLSPHMGNVDKLILLNLCETLVNSDDLGNVTPAAAASWQTKDNKTFVFNLQKNAKWSNGKPVTAEDFVYSFRRGISKDAKKASKRYITRMFIKNASAISKGELPPTALGVKALNQHKLQIVLEKPAHFFLQTLTNPHTVPVNKEMLEKHPNDWKSPRNFVCNGAYNLSSVSDKKIVAVKNKHYWNSAQTHINKVTWLKSISIADDAEKFFKGQIDATYRVPIERFWVIEKDHPDEIKSSDKITSYYLALNVDRYPLDDVRVRKALSYAIDRNILTFAYLAQGHKPSYLFTPANATGFNVKPPAYAKMTQQQRTQKAKEFLKQAGFSAKNPAVITISYEHTDRQIINYQAVSAIKRIVESSLDSMKIVLDPIEDRKTYIQKIRGRDYQVMRRGSSGTHNDAAVFLNVFISTSDGLRVGFKNSKYDIVMKKALSTLNDKDRSQLYEQAETMLREDMRVIPLYRGGHTRLINSKIGNFPYNNPEEKFYVKNLYLKK